MPISLAKFSPDSCQTNQTNAKKQHGGGFGNSMPEYLILTCTGARKHRI